MPAAICEVNARSLVGEATLVLPGEKQGAQERQEMKESADC